MYADWPTKRQAAEIIGCSTKTLEIMATRRQLQQATRRNPATGAHVTVYHPGDVERIRQERNPEGEPFILPPGAPIPENSQNPAEPADTQALAVITESSEKRFAALVQAVATAQRYPPPLWLTLPEAIRYTGLGAAHLCSNVEWQRIGPRRAKVCRRKDLDAL